MLSGSKKWVLLVIPPLMGMLMMMGAFVLVTAPAVSAVQKITGIVMAPVKAVDKVWGKISGIFGKEEEDKLKMVFDCSNVTDPKPKGEFGDGEANCVKGLMRTGYGITSTTIPEDKQWLVEIYKQAGSDQQIPWLVLAAINWQETNWGESNCNNGKGGAGWMQFNPDTWDGTDKGTDREPSQDPEVARDNDGYGRDVGSTYLQQKKRSCGGKDGNTVYEPAEWTADFASDGKANPYDPVDAIFAAGRYLHNGGFRAPTDGNGELLDEATAFSGDKNLGGVAGTGISAAEHRKIKQHPYGGTKITEGKYIATAYGPPWGGIQGAGNATAAGLIINGKARKSYWIAVDPQLISYGAMVYLWPNPFGRKGPFMATDTGGAIKQRRIDFYDWRGRSYQYKWGKRETTVTKQSTQGGDSGDGDQARPETTDQGPAYDPAQQGGGGSSGGGGTGGQGAAGGKCDDYDVPKGKAQGFENLPEGNLSGGDVAWPLCAAGGVGQGPNSGGTHVGSWPNANGYDLITPERTPVVAVEDGTIDPNRYGPLGSSESRLAGERVNLVDTPSKRLWYYAHMIKIIAKPGEHVKKGDVIGLSGSANGVPHLHITVNDGNDPTKLLGLDGALGGSGGSGSGSDEESGGDGFSYQDPTGCCGWADWEDFKSDKAADVDPNNCDANKADPDPGEDYPDSRAIWRYNHSYCYVVQVHDKYDRLVAELTGKAGSGGGEEEGDAGGPVDLKGKTPKEIIDTYIVPMAKENKMVTGATPKMVEEANARHGTTVSGSRSDHQGPPEFAWASDMSNGSAPTPEMDKLAKDLQARFKTEPKLNFQTTGAGGSTQYGVSVIDGYRFQLIYRSYTGGNHDNHVHFGVQKR